MGARAAPEAGEPRGRPRRPRGDPPLRAPGQGTPGCQAWDSGDVARHVCDTHGNIRDRAGPASPSPRTPVRPRTTPEGGTPTSRPSETTRLPLSVTFFLLDAPTEASRFGAGPRRPSPAWAGEARAALGGGMAGRPHPAPDLGAACPRTPRLCQDVCSDPGRVTAGLERQRTGRGPLEANAAGLTEGQRATCQGVAGQPWLRGLGGA